VGLYRLLERPSETPFKCVLPTSDHKEVIQHPSRTNFGLRLVYRVGLGLGLVFIFV